MNLDSTVRIELSYNAEAIVAELVEGWTDGEIADLLEGDDDALAALTEEAMEWVLSTEAEVEEIEVDGKSQ